MGSALIYEKDFSTRPAYVRHRRANDFGWVFLTAGSAAFVTSFFLGPKKPKKPPEVEARLRLSPTHVELGVTY